MAESAAESEIVIRPNAANNINKWEGEDDDEDVKVNILVLYKKEISEKKRIYHIVKATQLLLCCSATFVAVSDGLS